MVNVISVFDKQSYKIYMLQLMLVQHICWRLSLLLVLVRWRIHRLQSLEHVSSIYCRNYRNESILQEFQFNIVVIDCIG